MTTAGEMRHRIAFDERQTVDDGMGNEQGAFVQQFVVAARVRAKFGGEAVSAARLTGQQPVVITVRASSQTDRITTDWRARDVRSDPDPAEQTSYNIRSIADPDDSGAWLELFCQTGVAP
jgi:head-tail adaptor